jgi:hypothetical protein
MALVLCASAKTPIAEMQACTLLPYKEKLPPVIIVSI